MFPRRWLAACLLLACATPATAQDEPASDSSWLRDRVRVSGEASASMSTIDAEREGWFNYSDYDVSSVRTVRLSLVGEVQLAPRVAVLGEFRTVQFERPEAYALYLRVRPFASIPLDVHAGRVPPTFGSFPRRLYVADNPLIGLPLAYQYLTSLRADALPATAEELVQASGRGWLVNYSQGNTEAEAGLPIANALRWDTGVQVRWQPQAVTVWGAVTQGTIGDPRLSDDNGGAQLSSRVVYAPHPAIAIGASVASGSYLRASLEPLLAGSRSLRAFRQDAFGADLELSYDRWLVRGEAVWNRWQQPALETGGVRRLGARAGMIESRYRLWPGLYAAARLEHLGFSRLTTRDGLLPWDAPVSRGELGLGWSVHRHVLLKASWQRNRRSGGRIRGADLGAVQVVTWF
ncbi:MAG TPA: hypothetical protein VMF13_08460 [Luteitalea sp.]|nr:hypothetical protein [Luteitalea sp.]